MVESLLGGACGSVRGGERRSLRRRNVSFAQVVNAPSASPPGVQDHPPRVSSEWRVVHRRRSPPIVSATQSSSFPRRRSPPVVPVGPPPAESSAAAPPSSDPSSSLKRRRSPSSNGPCSKCFRPGHSALDCRHLITCRHCGCSGHMAANCPLPSSDPQAPRRRRSRPQRAGSLWQLHPSAPQLPQPPHRLSSATASSAARAPPSSPPSRFTVSLPVSNEIIAAKEELKTLAIITLISGNACLSALANELPSMLGVSSGQRVSNFREHQLTLSLPSAQVVKSAVRLGRINLHGEFGPFSVTVSPWSPEIGSIGAASGDSSWIVLHNLPLHCWRWSSSCSQTGW